MCFLCKKLSIMLECGSLVREQLNMEDESKFCSPVCSTFEAFSLWNMWSGIIMEKWDHYIDKNVGCSRLQFSGAFIDLLSVLLRCNDSAGTQKAVVDKTGRRPPNSNHNLFWCKFLLWEVLWSFLVQPPSWSLLVCHIKSTFSSYINLFEKWFIDVA